MGLMLAGFLATALTCHGEILMGMARVDITPPVGGRTTGYHSAPVTDGIHDPVEVQAVVLRSGERTVALVVADLCVFNSKWLHEEAQQLGVDTLLLSNTHTHAGPSMRQDDFPNAEKPWKRTVEERTRQAIEEARAAMTPAYFAVSCEELTLGYNRLVPQAEGHALTHFENPERIPYGPVDPTITVIRAADAEQNIRAVFVSYACHPVVLGPKNSQISAGFPGVLRRHVEKTLGDEVSCVFLQGGAGDINPLILPRADDPDEDFKDMETMGRLLGDRTLSILQSMDDVEGRSEGFDLRSEVIEVKHRFIRQETVSVGTAAILLNGDIGLVTMPGEPFHWFQRTLRERAALPHVLFLGYCSNGGYPWPSYLPDLMSAARGGYGASDTTTAAVGTGERLLNLGVAQLYEMRGMLKDKPVRHLQED